MLQHPVVYLNLNTQRSAADVGGWHPRMLRVAAAVLLSPEGVPVYSAETITQLPRQLAGAARVVGWNLRQFDLEVLAGHVGERTGDVDCVDLMEDLEAQTGGRLPLNSVCAATLGIKVADSMTNVAHWKAGDVEKVIHNTADGARAIKSLHEYGRANGEVFLFSNSGPERRRIPVRWLWVRDLESGATAWDWSHDKWLRIQFGSGDQCGCLNH